MRERYNAIGFTPERVLTHHLVETYVGRYDEFADEYTGNKMRLELFYKNNRSDQEFEPLYEVDYDPSTILNAGMEIKKCLDENLDLYIGIMILKDGKSFNMEFLPIEKSNRERFKIMNDPDITMQERLNLMHSHNRNRADGIKPFTETDFEATEIKIGLASHK